MPRVVVVAPSYDQDTHQTVQWAENLSFTLSSRGFDVELLDRSRARDATLRQYAAHADHVVFFGHGEPLRLLGQPRWWQHPPTLVDAATISVISHANVYVVACCALSGLGPAHGQTSQGQMFVGYSQPFGFSIPLGNYFEEVVNRHVIAGIESGFTPQLVADLRQAWEDLEEAFLNGSLNIFRRSGDAALAAGNNAACVGYA